MAKVRVLMIGLEPTIIDFSDPGFADKPGQTADKLRAAVEGDIARLRGMGYDADFCGVDYGETAETVARQALAAKSYDCVVIGGGVRLFASTTALFETLVNAVREAAPQAKFAFNTTPADTAEAVQRWFPAAE